MLRVIFETRKVNRFDRRMILKKLGNSQTVRILLLHSQLQRTNSAQGEPGVERRGNRARIHAHIPNLVNDLIGGSY